MENSCKLQENTIPGRPLLSAELDALADMFENGALEAATDPAAFVARVRKALVVLHQENTRLTSMLNAAAAQGVVISKKSNATG